jgi:hypothetical protein
MSGALVESYKVSATLAAQRIVSHVTGTANTVQLHQTLTALPLGVTIDTVLDTNQAIPVQLNGRAFVFFNDSCAAGSLVTGDASGRGISFALAQTSTSISAPAAYLGLLVGPSVQTTGTVAEVLINPGFDRNAR